MNDQWYKQLEFDVRCEWGEHGVEALAPVSDAVIIVDVLSFSTSVTVAVARGATVFPYRIRDSSADKYARSREAELAGRRGEDGLSLSPTSLQQVKPGSRIVLPSPNGSTLSMMTSQIPTYAGCLRNARAVARAAMRHREHISVIPAGERWEDDSTRFALEDLVGAGAIVQNLSGSLSPEAVVAVATFDAAKTSLHQTLKASVSGKELSAKGYADDVLCASEIDSDEVAPVLHEGAYVDALSRHKKP